MAPPTRTGRSLWLLLPALLAITAAAYHPVWHGGVLWDDDAHLTSPDLRASGGLWRIWFDVGATQQYYPLAHSAFWVMDRLWGADTLGYHLVNIALHAGSAWLVAVILRRLSVPGAWLAATIFALHPVHVESVAWMTELKNTLSGALYLSAALAYLQFAARRAWRWYAAALGLFVLALLSKTVTATLPVGLLIVLWWQRGRIDWRRDALPLVPMVGLGLAAGLFTAWVERTFVIGATSAAFDLTAIQRGLIAGRALWFYLGKIVWPADLIFIYPRWTVSADVWWQYLFPIAAAGLTVVLWRLRTRSRAPLAAWLYFCATLLPALGFVNVFPFRYSFVADHFQYLASLGVVAIGAAGIALALDRLPGPRRMLQAGACVLVAVPLAMLTARQSREYVAADTLYLATLDRNPDCWMAHSNLAALTLAAPAPDYDGAFVHLRESLRLNPDNEVAHNNLGVLFQRQGRFEDAMREHREAVRLLPGYADAFSNLGADAESLGRHDEAIAYYTEAIRLKPNHPGAHQNMGIVLQNVGRLDDAIAHIREALRLNPEYADAHDNLGTALQRAGRTEEAVAEYREAVRLKPTLVTWNNLGIALLRLGRSDDAVPAFEAALRLNPDAGMAHDNLGRALLDLGRRDEALAEFQNAVRLEPRYAPAHEHLASIHEAAGRLGEAMAEYTEALKLAPGSAEAHNNLGVVLARLGRVADAVPHFAEALRLRPDFKEAQANLARARGR